MLRRTQDQVLKELPRAMIDVVHLSCTDEARRVIKEEEEKTVEIAGDRDPELFALGETARIRQALAKYKIKESIPFLKDLLEETNKIVVFFHHKSVLKELLSTLKSFNPVYISGEVLAQNRNRLVRYFNETPNCRVFLGQIQACGEGLDGLQHNCHTCVFIEPSWSPTDITQCVGRLKRIGQKRMVNVYLLVIKATLEAKMMSTAKWKEQVVNKIINTTGEKTMHLEERLENLEKKVDKFEAVNLKLVQTIQELITTMAGKTPAAPKAAGSKGKKPKNEPKPSKASVTVDQVRGLAADICKKLPNGEGKQRCVAVIQSLGGTKLDQLDGPALEKCYEQFQEILTQEADGGAADV